MTYWRFAGALAAVSLVTLIGVAGAAPQDSKQTALVDGQLRYVHKDSPAFAFDIPKKKKKYAEIREQWRFVDLAARRTQGLDQAQKAITEAEAQEPRDEDRIKKLYARKRNIERYYDSCRVRLEVKDKPEERIEIQVGSISKDAKIEKLGPRSFAASNWNRVDYLKETETTTKRLKKVGAESYHYLFKAEDKRSSARLFYRVDIYLVYDRSRQNRYRVLYMHRMPAADYNKKKMKNTRLLFACLKMDIR